MRISSALLIIASVGATFMVGAWDNLNSIDRSSTQGYQTLAQVAGASRSPPGLPFTFDNGWRPRLIEQTTLLHLKWIDRDGQVRHRRHVAVTDDFARRVLLGNKIQIPEIQILVIDEGNAVPVALADIVERRAALEGLFLFGKLPTVAALGSLGLLLVATARQRRRAAQGSCATRPLRSLDRDIPFKLTICAAMFLYLGWLFVLSAWNKSANRVALEARGLTTDAHVLDSYAGSTAASVSISYSLVLGWRDLSGNERTAVLREIGWELYRKIRDGQRFVKIRYVPEDATVPPIILDN